MKKGKIGVILMMFKQQIAEHGIYAVLKKISDMGIRTVEVSQIDMTPENIAQLQQAQKDLGIQIAANHTAYNMEGSHSEVFVGLPAFAHSFIHYCQHTLIPESCMTREESIAWLAQLAANIESL